MKTGSGRQRMGWRAVVLFSILGILGQMVVTVLTISAYMAQELRNRKLTYLDGFGGNVGSSFVLGNGGNVSVGYGGTAGSESWTDCFVVEGFGICGLSRICKVFIVLLRLCRWVTALQIGV
jgi:hypothetical protein